MSRDLYDLADAVRKLCKEAAADTNTTARMLEIAKERHALGDSREKALDTVRGWLLELGLKPPALSAPSTAAPDLEG